MGNDYPERLYTYGDIETIISAVLEKIGEETDKPNCDRCMRWYKKKLPALIKNETKLFLSKKSK